MKPPPGARFAAYQPKLDNLRGALWMLLAVTALTAMFAIIKQMVSELPFFVVALTRTVVALLVLSPWLIRHRRAGIATSRLKTHFLRAFFGIASFACITYAIGRMLLSDAMVLSFTSPLWSIVISALVLGEAIRRHRILGTIAGFLGVVMIVKPQAGLDPAMLIALLSAALSSAAIITLKSLSATEPPGRNVFYFFFFGTLILLGPAIATWQTPTWTQCGWLIGAGLLGGFGQIWLARAYDAAEVTAIAPLDFLRMPLAAAFGFAIFHEVPDAWSAAGATVIFVALLFITRHYARESRARKPAQS